MKIDKFISKIKEMGYTPYLGDHENYYLKENDNVRIHFDTDTKEVYPLWTTFDSYEPISQEKMLRKLKLRSYLLLKK